MAVSKVIYGGETLVDLTSDTVTANDLAEGVTATAADGTQITGLLPKVEIDSELSSTSTNPVQNKVINAALAGYLPFNNTYITDANSWLTNGYVKTSRNSTKNIPSVCTGADRWGILFFIAENAANGTGTQMYYPIDGTYKGRIFTRNLLYKTPSDWVLMPLASDFATVATSGSYNDLTNKPTIPTVPTTVSSFTNDAGYLTEHQSLAAYAKTADLSPVATSGSYEDLTNKPTIPSAYTLPTASASTLGGVKVGSGLSINTSGVLSNSYSYTLPNATSSVLGGVKIGSNITVSSGTISLTKSNVTSALGYTPPTTNTTYSVATTSSNGLMSSTDKSKLDGIATGANNYTHPSTHPASMITGLATVATSGSYNDLTNKPTIPTVPTTVSSFTNDAGYLTEHQSLAAYAKTEDLATVATSGLYSDLSGTPTIPDAVTVDTAMSPSSTNPVQNKVVYTAINDMLKGFMLNTMTNAISWRSGSQAGASITGTQYTGNAATATKATQDADGNVISSTYAKTASLASVATSGSYNDLSDTPTIPDTPKAYITETYVSGTNWYRKWSDGWVEQGGVSEKLSNSNKLITITFLKAFLNTNYTLTSASRCCDGETSAGKIGVFSATKNTTSVTICLNGWTDAYNGIFVEWRAAGQGA